MTTHSPKAPKPLRALRQGPRQARSQDGFTLIEALVATVVLIVGLTAITNLMVVAISANSLGSKTSIAAFVASQKMEQLRSIPFDDPEFADSDVTSLDADFPNHSENVPIEGAGTYHTRWNIRTVVAYGQSLKYIAVRTESLAPMGRLTRAEFTTFRACTLTGCNP